MNSQTELTDCDFYVCIRETNILEQVFKNHSACNLVNLTFKLFKAENMYSLYVWS